MAERWPIRTWATCYSCGHREMVRRCAFERRFRPQCSACGGFLRPSSVAEGDFVQTRDALLDNPHVKKG